MARRRNSLLIVALVAAAPVGAQQVAYSGRVVPPMTGPSLPSLGSDEAPPPAPRRWPHALPFYAQKVIDRGYDLPNPYDIGASLYLGREQRVLSSLQVGFNDRPMSDASFVQFPNTKVETKSFQAQAGAFVFPFLNVYGILGYTQGKGDIDIAIPGRDLMGYLGVPGCSLGPTLQPALCNETIRATAHADYEGPSYGAGFTVAGAHRDFFFALPVTYVISDMSVSDTKSKTWNIAPRVGWNQHLGPQQMLTWYVGGTYLKSDFNITGEAVLPTAGTAIGGVTRMRYSIHVSPRQRWNALAGANWTVSKFWSAMAEVGFAGERSDLLLTAFYRF